MKQIQKTDNYSIYVEEGNNEGFNFPYILCLPHKLNDGDTLFVESNNEENPKDLNKSAEMITQKVLELMSGSNIKSPILIPILPTEGIDGRPYFQQLSHECFGENLPKEKTRIDLQLLNVLQDAKQRIFQLTDKKLDEKIFMHGYSASGVFAQRFALIHPEVVGAVCVGGAIGSIPMPLTEENGIPLDYPVGVNNYAEIFGKEFNFEAYKKINFRYYVAEKEDKRLSESRKKEDGSPAPMHDMSYMQRSMPQNVGKNLRFAFGLDMNSRCRNQLAMYKEMGLNISAHPPYKDIMHNEIRNLAYKYIDDCMCEYIKTKEKNII